MKTRPASVALIGWYVIVTSLISMVNFLAALENPALNPWLVKIGQPRPGQIVLTFLGLAVTLAGGAAILKGRNWGRWLYLAWRGVFLGVGFSVASVKAAAIPAGAIYLIIAWFLFQREANAFFARGEDPSPIPGEGMGGC